MPPGLTILDFLVVAGFLVGITALGIWSGRKVTTTADYFMPRRFGKFYLTLNSFSVATSAEQAVVLASKSYSSGVSGIWYQWFHLVTMPFYWLLAPMLRRFRAITLGDIYGLRFGASVATLFVLTGITKSILTLGLGLKGSSALLGGLFGGVVSGDTLVLILTVIFVAYSLFGGFTSAVFTNAIQGLLTLLFSFLLLPFVWRAVGGGAGIRDVLPADMLALTVPGGIDGFTVTMMALAGLIAAAVIPHNLGIAAASRVERDGQFGFLAGLFLKRLCAGAWCLTGVAAAALYAGQQIDPDGLYGRLAAHFLPAVAPGLVGLFIASALAEVMGTCSGIMNAAAALLIQNFYRPLRPGRSESHYLAAGRGGAVLVVVVSVGFAFWLPGVVKGLELIVTAAPIIGVVFWCGLFWRRTTTAAAWAATLTGYTLWMLLQVQAVLEWLRESTFLAGRIAPTAHGLDLALGWQLFIVLGGTAAVVVIVSLFTAPPPPEQLNRFYALRRTPVMTDEDLPAPCTLPVGAVTPAPRVMTRAWGLELDWPDGHGIKGFVISTLLILAMIAGFVWIAP